MGNEMSTIFNYFSVAYDLCQSILFARQMQLPMIIKNGFMVSVGPLRYWCRREVAEQERSVRVARGDSFPRLYQEIAESSLWSAYQLDKCIQNFTDAH